MMPPPLTAMQAMLRCARAVMMPHTGDPTVVRIGLHTGPVVTGLIGTKLPKFSVFGDAMNMASRMESTCRPGESPHLVHTTMESTCRQVRVIHISTHFHTTWLQTHG